MLDELGEDTARLKDQFKSCYNARTKNSWAGKYRPPGEARDVEFKDLIASIRKHPDLSKRLDLINSIDGIGLQTAVAILAACLRSARSRKSKLSSSSGLLGPSEGRRDLSDKGHAKGIDAVPSS